MRVPSDIEGPIAGSLRALPRAYVGVSAFGLFLVARSRRATSAPELDDIRQQLRNELGERARRPECCLAVIDNESGRESAAATLREYGYSDDELMHYLLPDEDDVESDE